MTRPGAQFKNRLFDILLALPSMDETADRSLLLRNLPRNPVGAIKRSPARLADLNNVIEAADGMGQLVDSGEWALVIVARNAMQLALGGELGARLQALLAELETRPTEFAAAPVPEIVIGQDERLPVDFLEKGLAASRSVAKLLVPKASGGVKQIGDRFGCGTGWLITSDLLITNFHVIEARDPRFEPAITESEFRTQASLVTAWFDYDIEGGPHTDCSCRELVQFDPKLDYALLRLDSKQNGAAHGSDSTRKPLSLASGQQIHIKGDRLNIIQHPRCGPKLIAIRSNYYYDCVSTSEHPERIRYLTDTEPGSSGSPVFSDDWRVVAIHHASVPVSNREYKGEVITYNNQGIRIWAILNDLRAAVRNEILGGARVELGSALIRSLPDLAKRLAPTLMPDK